MLSLHRHIQSGSLPCTIVAVISSRRDAPGLALASREGLATQVIERRSLSEAEFQRQLTHAVLAVNPDLVCMAGFLSLWHIPDQMLGRVLNIHPALLPAFGGPGMYGRRVHEAVLAAGCKESGCTVHFCDNEYDHGPIIVQRRVAIPPQCTVDQLADLVFREELEAYPQALRAVLSGEARWPAGRVGQACLSAGRMDDSDADSHRLF